MAMQDARSFLARLEATQTILAATQGRPTFDNILESEKKELLEALEHVSVRGKGAADGKAELPSDYQA